MKAFYPLSSEQFLFPYKGGQAGLAPGRFMAVMIPETGGEIVRRTGGGIKGLESNV